MNLGQVTTQFTSLMNRRDLTANTTLVNNFMAQAVMRIQRELRCPLNEKWAFISFSVGTMTDANIAGETFPIGSISYNATTGIVTATLGNAADGTKPAFNVGDSITIAGVTGSGSYAALNGNFTAGANTDNGTVYWTISRGLTLSITPLNQTLSIPNDFLEMIGIYPQGDWINRLKKDKLERVANYAKFATDKPFQYARQGSQWVLGPAPAGGSTVLLGYYAEFSPLVNSTDQNILSIVAWDLIVYAALSQACLFYNDKRRGSSVNDVGEIIDGFEGEYNRIKHQLQDMGDEDELDEAHMQPVHAYPDDDTDNFEIWVP